MKTILNAFTIISIMALVACSGKKEGEATEAADNEVWPEMDEFHMIIAESFHPFKDSANLDPAKANAAEMAKVAERWAGAPIPEKVNTNEVKDNLETLKTQTASFAQLVQSGDSTQVGTALTGIHDLFHNIQEAWYGGGEGHDHEHH